MKVATRVNEAREFLKRKREAGGTIGLVPTMGFLHEGHLSLVRRAMGENDTCVVSIFVNPLQFGPSEDFDAYPRDMGRDLDLLASEGVELVFAPGVDEMFSPDHSTIVSEKKLSGFLCGSARPGHFDGVCTIVLKLFNILRPDRAYFGEKDYQQLQVIRRMVRDLDLEVKVIGCPIVREEDGLALSSRNTYLGEAEREQAIALSRALAQARSVFDAGERGCRSILDVVRMVVESYPMVSLEYAEIRDAVDLSPVKRVDRKVVVAVAARIGRARLIDNTILCP
ncbi:MAG TPA: pantoate--beta-alanine ligase [Synergistales bacterium]|nr:pantoate--beta-alanine ligase [Synergistales bacterium]HPC75329.1 pantoate--beta-alanine ligase [Synergistales bacterium]HRS48234.1 pantoate--beta-alanine ligase [Thermovirgaceae bacterium]HRU90572.1 pantoate--beta-alanine ligase [Thermovirgaceae bacterium]